MSNDNPSRSERCKHCGSETNYVGFTVTECLDFNCERGPQTWASPDKQQELLIEDFDKAGADGIPFDVKICGHGKLEECWKCSAPQEEECSVAVCHFKVYDVSDPGALFLKRSSNNGEDVYIWSNICTRWAPGSILMSSLRPEDSQLRTATAEEIERISRGKSAKELAEIFNEEHPLSEPQADKVPAYHDDEPELVVSKHTDSTPVNLYLSEEDGTTHHWAGKGAWHRYHKYTLQQVMTHFRKATFGEVNEMTGKSVSALLKIFASREDKPQAEESVQQASVQQASEPQVDPREQIISYELPPEAYASCFKCGHHGIKLEVDGEIACTTCSRCGDYIWRKVDDETITQGQEPAPQEIYLKTHGDDSLFLVRGETIHLWYADEPHWRLPEKGYKIIDQDMLRQATPEEVRKVTGRSVEDVLHRFHERIVVSKKNLEKARSNSCSVKYYMPLPRAANVKGAVMSIGTPVDLGGNDKKDSELFCGECGECGGDRSPLFRICCACYNKANETFNDGCWSIEGCRTCEKAYFIKFDGDIDERTCCIRCRVRGDIISGLIRDKTDEIAAQIMEQSLIPTTLTCVKPTSSTSMGHDPQISPSQLMSEKSSGLVPVNTHEVRRQVMFYGEDLGDGRVALREDIFLEDKHERVRVPIDGDLITPEEREGKSDVWLNLNYEHIRAHSKPLKVDGPGLIVNSSIREMTEKVMDQIDQTGALQVERGNESPLQAGREDEKTIEKRTESLPTLAGAKESGDLGRHHDRNRGCRTTPPIVRTDRPVKEEAARIELWRTIYDRDV
jgi:hypothetical protein